MKLRLLAVVAALGGTVACGSDGGGGGGGDGCPREGVGFASGDPNGHADPFGAKAAGQARAGRVISPAQVVQTAHGRQRVRVGDFVLANDRVAAYIEDKGLSDGYQRFGGDLLSIDRVGDDGRPLGKSYFGETLMALGIDIIDPDSVSVMNDGSDGNAAVVRVTGPLKPIPFLDGSLGVLFSRRYSGLMAAYDFVLEPGSAKLLIRVGIKNAWAEPLTIGGSGYTDEIHGFFHGSRNQLASPETGLGKAKGTLSYVGYVNDESSFAWRLAGGVKLDVALEESGSLFTFGQGFEVPVCETYWRDHVEVIPGGPEFDGLLEAVRQADGRPSRTVTGHVKDTAGAPVAGAWVHALGESDAYLSRTLSDANGKFALHLEPGVAAKLVAQHQGYALEAAVDVPAAVASQDLTLSAHGTIHVTAAGKLPVRIHVIPTAPVASAPAVYGVEAERDGRLWVERAVTGEATLRVPPGEHRVVVTRGWEYEHLDTTVTVAAGQTVEVAADLAHSLDSTGWMCADFHIHSWFSADSNDPPVEKVKSAITEGLDIPVSSEHEWIIDFQPIIQQLGLEKWAFGMPSEELTTFTWGHFGVVPLFPKPDELNNGAVEWVGRKPPEMFADVQARPENPVLIVNHPSSSGFGGYFTQSAFDVKAGAGKKKDIWSTEFDAIEVFNDSDLESNREKSVAQWFALLNAGHTLWAVGSSDTHHIRSSLPGTPRTCLYFGHDDPTKLTANTVRDVLAQGTATVSGGLFMTVVGPGGAKPGSKVNGKPATADFTVTVSRASWVDATSLEVIVNGITQTTEPLAPLGDKFVNQVTVKLDPARPRNWVVFHAKGEKEMQPLMGKRPFAVSNPVFFE
ncbi:MAG: CehA/McbA family metallohydrolase [Polyangiaceae bacterium]|nr:CehA/McbA family metallohydrolase [Polyangiaceae bacterium]